MSDSDEPASGSRAPTRRKLLGGFAAALGTAVLARGAKAAALSSPEDSLSSGPGTAGNTAEEVLGAYRNSIDSTDTWEKIPSGVLTKYISKLAQAQESGQLLDESLAKKIIGQASFDYKELIQKTASKPKTRSRSDWTDPRRVQHLDINGLNIVYVSPKSPHVTIVVNPYTQTLAMYNEAAYDNHEHTVTFSANDRGSAYSGLVDAKEIENYNQIFADADNAIKSLSFYLNMPISHNVVPSAAKKIADETLINIEDSAVKWVADGKDIAKFKQIELLRRDYDALAKAFPGLKEAELDVYLTTRRISNPWRIGGGKDAALIELFEDGLIRSYTGSDKYWKPAGFSAPADMDIDEYKVFNRIPNPNLRTMGQGQEL